MRGLPSPIPAAGWPPKGSAPQGGRRARKVRPYAETEGHPVGGPDPPLNGDRGRKSPGISLTDRRKGDILLENDPLPKVGNGGLCRVCNFHIFLFGGRYETFERHLEQCAGVRPAAGRHGQRPLSRGPVRAVGGPPGPLCCRGLRPHRPAGGAGVRRRGGRGAAGPGSGVPDGAAGAGARPPVLHLSQRGHGLPPVGAPATGPDAGHGGGGGAPAGGGGGGTASADPAPGGAGPGLGGAADRGEL